MSSPARAPRRHVRIINWPGRFIVHLQFEPTDCWIGWIWRRTSVSVHVFVGLVPMLSLHVAIWMRAGES